MKDIHLKDIKKDQVFFENCYGYRLKLVALEDAYISGHMEHDGKQLKQWSCKAQNVDTGEIIDYLTTENLGHYGAKLCVKSDIPRDSTIPQYTLTKIGVRSGIDYFDEVNEYILTGTLINESFMQAGSLIMVDDDNETLFRSSRVVDYGVLNDRVTIITTKNSKYKLEKV